MATYIITEGFAREEAKKVAHEENIRTATPPYKEKMSLVFPFRDDGEHDRFANALDEEGIDYDIQV